jgi:hypothetical protein
METRAPARVPVDTTAIRMADLPRVEVTPVPEEKKPPTSDPAEVSPEIIITGGRITVRNRPFGFIEASGLEMPIFPQSGGGVDLWFGMLGGDGQVVYLLVQWQTLAAAPDGALQYEEGFDWYNVLTRKAFVAWRMKAPAQPIAGADGLAYAFRTVCPACGAGSGERLHVITPSLGWEGQMIGDSTRSRGGGDQFSHTEIPIRPGDGGSIAGNLGSSAIKRFKKSGAAPTRAEGTFLAVEVTQGVGEADPTALVSTAPAPE